MPLVPVFSHLVAVFSEAERMQTDILTIKEVSAYLKITEKTAYRLTAEGKIPGFKVGGAWRFRKQEIDAWIDERMKDSGASS
ncbi:helix-turn-helix domain-containing protein [Rhodovulum bhavnagarense]